MFTVVIVLCGQFAGRIEDNTDTICHAFCTSPMEIRMDCIHRYFPEAMGTAHIHIADGNMDGLCLKFFFQV